MSGASDPFAAPARAASRPTVLHASTTEPAPGWIDAGAAVGLDLRAVQTRRELELLLAAPEVVAVVGDGLADADLAGLAAAVASARSARGGGLPFVAIAQDEVEGATFVAAPQVPAEQVAGLIRGAISAPRPGSYESPPTAEHAELVRQALALARAVGTAQEPAEAATAIESWLRQNLDSDHEEVLFFDEAEDVLWSGRRAADLRPSQGLVGYATRSRRLLPVEDFEGDPRCVPELDAPAAGVGQHLLVVPVLRPNGAVSAVAVAWRDTRPFSEIDVFGATAMRDLVGRSLDLLELQLSSDALLDSGADLPLFRSVAVQAQEQAGREGQVLRIAPAWVPGSFWLVVVVVIVAGAFVGFGERTRYERGAAVVRLDHHSEVVATSEGVVQDLWVAEGTRVAEGDPIARLYDASEAEELSRREKGYESAVAAYLRDPNDEEAAAAVQQAWQSFEAAREGLRAKEMVAASAGRVENLQVTRGTFVTVGQPIASIVEQSDRSEVVAFFPPQVLSHAAIGDRLWLRLEGYERVRVPAEVVAVGDAAVAADRAAAVLGPRLASTLSLRGPQLVVRAALAGTALEIDGRAVALTDGMHAVAELATTTEPLYELLIPGREGP